MGSVVVQLRRGAEGPRGSGCVQNYLVVPSLTQDCAGEMARRRMNLKDLSAGKMTMRVMKLR